MPAELRDRRDWSAIRVRAQRIAIAQALTAAMQP
jgi:hypothetical protein